MRSASPEIINVFSQLGPNLTHAIQGVPERLIQVITPHLEGLQRSGHLQWNYGVQGIGFAAPGSPGGGNFGTLTVAISTRLAKIIAKIAKLA